ncbi:MAG: hypothetical protein FWG68_01150 [Defluviitaleaceae bacterium]|nr:hypothetical protein [Defluviitaleaceae bacterium]
MRRTTTLILSNVLKSRTDLKTILEENEKAINSPSLRDHLEELLETTKLQRKDVIKAAQIDTSYGHQIFNGTRTNPGREQVLALAFGFELDRKNADRLLRAAGVGALNPKNKRDAVVIYSLENKIGVAGVNAALFSLDMGGLVGE